MDYKNGKVYKILNTISDDVYVGSTCQSLSKRLAKHRASITVRTSYNKKLYVLMREIGVENFYIELIEECPCDNIEQLRAIEGKYIRELSTLNTQIAGRTKKQYADETREQRKVYATEYRMKNIESIKEKKKVYTQEHKEHKKAYDAEYRIENIDSIKEKKKIYRQENKDIIKEKRRVYFQEHISKENESIKCTICGGSYISRHKQTHYKTKKHLKAVAAQT